MLTQGNYTGISDISPANFECLARFDSVYTHDDD